MRSMCVHVHKVLCVTLLYELTPNEKWHKTPGSGRQQSQKGFSHFLLSEVFSKAKTLRANPDSNKDKGV